MGSIWCQGNYHFSCPPFWQLFYHNHSFLPLASFKITFSAFDLSRQTNLSRPAPCRNITGIVQAPHNIGKCLSLCDLQVGQISVLWAIVSRFWSEPSPFLWVSTTLNRALNPTSVMSPRTESYQRQPFRSCKLCIYNWLLNMESFINDNVGRNSKLILNK